MNKITFLAAFRHGNYERNNRIDATGEEAARVANIRRDPKDDYDTLGLSDLGVEQALRLRTLPDIASTAFDLCISSPYLRARQTADIVFENRSKTIRQTHEDLKERDLGIFNDIPREIYHKYFEISARRKREQPLDWDGHNTDSLLDEEKNERENVETLRAVGRRVVHVIAQAQSLILPKNELSVALSAHADVLVAMRSLPFLGNLSTNEQMTQPNLGVDNPQWIQNCQVDLYRREPDAPHMQEFRSIAACGDAKDSYDTGWVTIPR